MKHTPNKREENEGFCGFGQEVIFTIEPPIKGEPSEAAFHNPAFLDDYELTMSPKGVDLCFCQFLTFWEPIPVGIGIRTLNDLHAITDIRFDPTFPFAPVATIGKEMQLQLRLLRLQLQEELLAASAI